MCLLARGVSRIAVVAWLSYLSTGLSRPVNPSDSGVDLCQLPGVYRQESDGNYYPVHQGEDIGKAPPPVDPINEDSQIGYMINPFNQEYLPASHYPLQEHGFSTDVQDPYSTTTLQPAIEPTTSRHSGKRPASGLHPDIQRSSSLGPDKRLRPTPPLHLDLQPKGPPESFQTGQDSDALLSSSQHDLHNSGSRGETGPVLNVQGQDSEHSPDKHQERLEWDTEEDLKDGYTLIRVGMLVGTPRANLFDSAWVIEPRPRLVPERYEQNAQGFLNRLKCSMKEIYKIVRKHKSTNPKYTRVGKLPLVYASTSQHGQYVRVMKRAGGYETQKRSEIHLRRLLLTAWYFHEVYLETFGLECTSQDQLKLENWLWEGFGAPKNEFEFPVIGFTKVTKLEDVNESRVGPVQRAFIHYLSSACPSIRTDSTAINLLYLYRGHELAHIPEWDNEFKFRVNLIRSIISHQKGKMDRIQEAIPLGYRGPTTTEWRSSRLWL